MAIYMASYMEHVWDCRPKAALLFWFFSDFRCGVPLFIVFLIIYKYQKVGRHVYVVAAYIATLL